MYLSHNRITRRNRLLKLINDYERFIGKTIFQKLIYFLSVNKVEDLFYDFTKNRFGPYSDALEEDLSILSEEGLVKIVKMNSLVSIIPNKEKIDNYFEENDIEIITNRSDYLIESNIIQFFEYSLNNDINKIELAATLHFQTLLESKPIKESIFKNIEIWKPDKFTKKQKEKMWDLLRQNKLIDKDVIKLNDFVDELKRLKPGQEDAYNFQRLVSRVISFLFNGQLKKIKLEDEINFGRKRIDISALNISKEGFFFDLHSIYKIYCPYLILECKNYSYDLENPVFDQIGMQLSDDIGNFGIIVCREIKDRDKMMKTIKDILSKHKKCVIFIEDKDIIEMLIAKLNGKKPDEILSSKLKELLF